jgi:hypothetical protein
LPLGLVLDFRTSRRVEAPAMAVRVAGGTMTLEIGDHVVAAARFSERAARRRREARLHLLGPAAAPIAVGMSWAPSRNAGGSR